MKRRECVLGLVPALPLISGCSGVLTNNIDPEQEASGTPERNDSTNRLLLSVESQLTSVEAQYELSLVRGVTQNHPPQINAGFTNTSNSQRQFRFGSEAPLSPQANDSPEHKLQLRNPPADGAYDADGCWRSSSDGWLMNATVATLQPGETISNTLDVLASPDVNGERYCLPTGTFTFTETTSIIASTTGVEDEENESEDTLRFTLTVQ